MNVITLGELLVEFLRRGIDEPLDQVGNFVGPFPAGAPAIFADAVAKLGHSCGFVGVVGEDGFGELITKKLKDDGVDISRIRTTSEYTTGTSFVTYFKDGSRKFIFHLRHAAAGQLSPSDVDPTYVSEADFLHVMGSTLSISDSSREACYRSVESASKSGVKISFDPNLRTELMEPRTFEEICRPILENCDLLLPNVEEVRLLTGDREPEESARRFLDMGIGIIAIKLGKGGSMLVTDEGRINISPFPVREVDPTGAGDSYDAGFICALLGGKSPEEAARFANAVGAISITEKGGMGGIPTKEEVESLVPRQI